MKTKTHPSFYPFNLNSEPGQCRGCHIRRQRSSWAYLAIQCKNFTGECFAKWYNEIQSSSLSEWHITKSLNECNELLQEEDGSHNVECGEKRNVSVQEISTDQIQQIASASLPPPYEVLINNQRYSFELGTEDGLTKYHLRIDHPRFCIILKGTRLKLIVPTNKGAIHTLNLLANDDTLHQDLSTRRYNFSTTLSSNEIYNLEVNGDTYNIQVIPPTHLLR